MLGFIRIPAELLILAALVWGGAVTVRNGTLRRRNRELAKQNDDLVDRTLR